MDPGVILVHLALSQARQMGSVPLPIYSANDPALFADGPPKISSGGFGLSKCRLGRSFQGESDEEAAHGVVRLRRRSDEGVCELELDANRRMGTADRVRSDRRRVYEEQRSPVTGRSLPRGASDGRQD